MSDCSLGEDGIYVCDEAAESFNQQVCADKCGGKSVEELFEPQPVFSPSPIRPKLTGGSVPSLSDEGCCVGKHTFCGRLEETERWTSCTHYQRRKQTDIQQWATETSMHFSTCQVLFVFDSVADP